MFSAKIARLCVLYEDLRIELLAIEAEAIPELDAVSSEIRRHYFLRRSIATLHEFSQALRLVNESNEFQNRVKTQFDAASSHRWQMAIRFFDRVDKLLRDVRNDVGGHFGLIAALYAVRHFKSDSVGSLELETQWIASHKEPTVTAKVHLAGEVAATVFFGIYKATRES